MPQGKLEIIKIKVAHIHLDKKFFRLGDAFLSSEFENQLLYLSNNPEPQVYAGNKVKIFDKNQNSIASIVQFCSDFDWVVFYSLDDFLSFIMLGLPPKTKVAWRFFGFELYYKNKEKYFSETTQKILLEEWNSQKTLLKTIKKFLVSFLKRDNKTVFLKAISRCNLFLGLYEEEHRLLKKDFPQLPNFIPVSLLTDLENKILPELNKENFFIVGHNRLIWNNHFDILQIINRNKNAGNFKACLFLNYGQKGYYYNKLVQFARKIEQVELIEDFMTLQEFENFYVKCAALVINSKRQMAGNNIRKAFELGTKVYLNPANSFYTYFKNNNFKVYTIQDFENDFKSGNLKLEQATAQHNYDCLVSITKLNSNQRFRDNVIQYFNPTQK
jgi:dTDP-N-acetylfucosamine:lipid II N-acetylfucosaminyltransferase